MESYRTEETYYLLTCIIAVVGNFSSVFYLILVTHYLYQSQCGSSTKARQVKNNNRREIQNRPVYEKEWKRKTPYDFVGCLAHIDLTYDQASFNVVRITGILEHNSMCQDEIMRRLPPVPLHDHVWQVALTQLKHGARYDCDYAFE